MVDPTALPTDNLWKCMALAGLMLAGFCGWLIFKILSQVYLSLDRTSAASTRLAAQAEADRVQTLDGVKEANARLKRASKRLEAATLARANAEATDLAIERLWVKVMPLLAGALFGLIISLTGFSFWYLKLQWYTDKQTKADFEDHMQELAAKRRAREKAAR